MIAPPSVTAFDGAWFGPEGRASAYRYLLKRRLLGAFDGPFTLGVVMLNPSTADDQVDDPTIRRCIGFASTWGFHQLVVANCFAFRATDPRGLRTAADPIGPANDEVLRGLAKMTSQVLCAWGNHAGDRGRAVEALLRDARCDLRHLGLTKAGAPRHPLYVRASTHAEIWRAA